MPLANAKRDIGVLIYPNFELLDLFGPLEMLGWCVSEFQLNLIAPSQGPVPSNMGPSAFADLALHERTEFEILLVPGGWGRSTPIDTEALVPWLTEAGRKADHVLTVCTGSALLAMTGLLDGHKATSNKALYHWVAEKRPAVEWQPKARWVHDDKYYTSSGVSAGMDMTLAFVSDLLGREKAEEVARGCEYDWHRDPTWDPFSAYHHIE
jgi:transcriptional regulator GlxA family with amidase domain